MTWNGSITYGDIFSIVLVLGMTMVVMLGGLLIVVSMFNRRK